MNTSDTIIFKIRRLYEVIYDWHKEHGQATIEKIIEYNQKWGLNDSNLKAYREALDIPRPEIASIDTMILIATKVRSGPLEVNYGAKVGDKLLGDIAKEIIELHNVFKKENQIPNDQLQSGELEELKITSEQEYFSKANQIYQEIILDNDKNIGGRVAIADTNWEFQKMNGLENGIQFRQFTDLHLQLIAEDDNLFQLALNGKITINTIIIE